MSEHPERQIVRLRDEADGNYWRADQGMPELMPDYPRMNWRESGDNENGDIK